MNSERAGLFVCFCADSVSYVEIYNEVMYDLLCTLPTSDHTLSPPQSSTLFVSEVRLMEDIGSIRQTVNGE